MTNFQHDYLVMDEFGRKEILCMASGKVIAARIERESEKFKGKTSFDFMKYADYREVPVLLNDGTIAFLMLCDECKNVDIGENEAKLITDQIRRARIIELKNSGKTDEFIEQVMANFGGKEVIRKMTGEEVRERFSKEFLESKAR